MILVYHFTSFFAMSTQQDIHAAGSENHPPMLNKDNYLPWSSRDLDCEFLVAKTFHEQTDDELTDKEQMMKGSGIGIQDKKAMFFNEWERFTSTDGESVEVNELRAERLARAHDPLALMANSNNPYNYPVFHQDQPSQNLGVQNVGNQNGLIVVPGTANKNVRFYNYRGMGHLARNCTVRPKRMDVAYLETQLLITQKEEARIQLQDEEFDLMAVVGYFDKIEEFNANCILMANLQQASTSST
ncbi:hypothetical protein Tco_1466883 [Tanacetum coccineum]